MVSPVSLRARIVAEFRDLNFVKIKDEIYYCLTFAINKAMLSPKNWTVG